MHWTLNNPGVVLRTDEKERIRLISHFQCPFVHDAQDRYVVILAYLRAVASRLGLSDAAIAHLDATRPGKTADEASSEAVRASPVDNPFELRWYQAYSIRNETTVVLIQQVVTHSSAGGTSEYLGCEHAGLRILVHGPDTGPFRITGMASALAYNVEIPRTYTSERVCQPEDLTRMCASFGLPAPRQWPTPEKSFLYRNPAKRRWEKAVDGKPVEKEYRVARSIRVVPGNADSRTAFPPFELIFDASDFSPLEARPLRTHAFGSAAGQVFEIDPVSATGNFEIRTSAAPKDLDTHRHPVTLEHLVTPEPNGQWVLSGKNVYLYDGRSVPGFPEKGWIGIAPPKAADPSFEFGARTNEFAAVNAYYHLDSMFTLIEELGMPFSSFPMQYTLPVPIIHRAAIHPGSCKDGNCVNAQLLLLPDSHPNNEAGKSAASPDMDERKPTPSPSGADEQHKPNKSVIFSFALADLARNPGSPKYPVEPLGIACDVRVVWHEFCHALIAASTNFPEFPFAHSAGDALAAINGDPYSKLGEDPENPLRFVTFPWGTTPTRRHDRSTENGWSWSSTLGRREEYEGDTRDTFGYAREQILSTTLFRLYRSIGGDAVQPPTKSTSTRAVQAQQVSLPPEPVPNPRRKAAALYVTYLIVRAICSLGPQKIVPAWNADLFAAALAEADIGTLTRMPPLDRIGGTVHKVIRWAFEKQGLFQDGPLPLDGSGRPEVVDVYVEDGRGGEYEYRQTRDKWESNAIWNSRMPDRDYAAAHDDAPVAKADNFIFVKVKNRGRAPAKNVTVSVFVAPEDQRTISSDRAGWTALNPSSGTVVVQNQIEARDELVFGPFPWHPTSASRYSILALIDANGDYSNLNPTTGLPCAVNTVPLELEAVVPLDNNIGLRTLAVA